MSIEYQQQVLLEINMAPYAWKVHYMELYPGHFDNTGYNTAERGGDVWDMLSEIAVHRYSLDEWKKYVPLFDGSISGVIAQLHGILAAHGNVVPVSLKLAILRTNLQLEGERHVYLLCPQLIADCEDNEDSAFAARFTETIRLLASFARLANEERRALEPDK